MKTNLEAKIETSDGSILLGTFDSVSKQFSFPHPFEEVGDRLKVREIRLDEITISYIYSSDYNPKLFLLKKDNSLIIEDYLDYHPYKIVVTYK